MQDLLQGGVEAAADHHMGRAGGEGLLAVEVLADVEAGLLEGLEVEPAVESLHLALGGGHDEERAALHQRRVSCEVVRCAVLVVVDPLREDRRGVPDLVRVGRRSRHDVHAEDLDVSIEVGPNAESLPDSGANAE